MIKFEAVLNTNGFGYWNCIAKPVTCTAIEIGYCNTEKDFAELRVYFNTATWDVTKDGLIYTDTLFLSELKAALSMATFDSSGISYSEQGMQGYDYVSLDVDKAFIDSMFAIAPEGFAYTSS